MIPEASAISYFRKGNSVHSENDFEARQMNAELAVSAYYPRGYKSYDNGVAKFDSKSAAAAYLAHINRLVYGK